MKLKAKYQNMQDAFLPNMTYASRFRSFSFLIIFHQFHSFSIRSNAMRSPSKWDRGRLGERERANSRRSFPHRFSLYWSPFIAMTIQPTTSFLNLILAFGWTWNTFMLRHRPDIYIKRLVCKLTTLPHTHSHIFEIKDSFGENHIITCRINKMGYAFKRSVNI